MGIYMLLFKWGIGVAYFMVAASSAALLTLLVFNKPHFWTNRFRFHDEHHLTKFIHIKSNFGGKGAFIAAGLAFAFVLSLPFLLVSSVHDGHILHAEIIKIIMRALS